MVDPSEVLVAARDEYTSTLQDILAEPVYSGLKATWNLSKAETRRNPLKVFQEKLCNVPQWNQEVINSYYKKIITASQISSEYFDKLIEAVFVSNVKILSVIKINNQRQTININIPDTKNFIHRVFIESARQFYTDPYLMDDREFGSNTHSEIQRNVKRSIRVINESVDKTIRGMIPMEDILNKYLQAQQQEEHFNTQKENSSDGGDDSDGGSDREADGGEPDSEADGETGLQTTEPAVDPFMEAPTMEPAAELPVAEPTAEPVYSAPTAAPEPVQENLHIDLKQPSNDNSFFSDDDE
jgi:hypothetical protein